ASRARQEPLQEGSREGRTIRSRALERILMSSNMMQGYRLSPHQHRLWAMRHAHATNSLCVIQITGKLEPEELKAALLDLIRRHEVLRTVYRRPPGMKAPLQVILDESDILWHY